MSVHIHFVNPNSAEETRKIAAELMIEAVLKKLAAENA